MITPANRTNLVSEYYFSMKLKEIAEMNSQGKNVINLGIGNPDMPAPQPAIDELCKAAQTLGNNGYQSYVGLPELRNAFAYWYKTFYRVTLDANTQILPLMGSKEGIMHVSMAFLNPGDKVLIPNPGYPTYRSNTLMVGAQIVEYNLTQESNWEPNFDELEQTDLTGVKLMWVNYPNMPTGQPANYNLYQKLINFGKKYNILICNDNPYSFILNDNPISILEVDGANEVAIELNSLSKAHNMAGFRVGMVAGNSRFISYILKMKSNIDSGMYKPLQHAAIAALHIDTNWYKNLNEQYKIRRQYIWQIFDLIGATYNKNQMGLFVWARIPDSYTDAKQLADNFLYKANVFVTPGSIFGSNGDRYARISLCCPVEVLKEAIERIKAIL